jgi:hypothetical protein
MQVGDPLDFAVENDVRVGDFTVIRAGSAAHGSVLSVKHGRLLGIGGKVVFGVDSIALITGEKVGLRARSVVKGRSHTWRMIAGMAATAVFYLPAAPLFLLTRGGNSTLLKGTEITGQIDCDTAVLSSGLPAEQTVAGLNDMMESLPPRVTNAQGREGDMVNLVFIGQKNELQDAFARARWVKTDAWNPLMAWHLFTQRTHDARLPMARFYMFGRIQDYSYALPDPGAIMSRRHHIRIWKTQYTVGGIPLWAGSASYDTAIEYAKHGRLINHTIDPEVDVERDFVGTDLSATTKLRQEYVRTQNPVFDAQTVSGEAYHSDSRILLLDLHQTSVATAAAPTPANDAPHSISAAKPVSDGMMQTSLK